jgi:hypothetical protein
MRTKKATAEYVLDFHNNDEPRYVFICNQKAGLPSFSIYPKKCLNEPWHKHYYHELQTKECSLEPYTLPYDDASLVITVLAKFKDIINDISYLKTSSEQKQRLFITFRAKLNQLLLEGTKEEQQKLGMLLNKILIYHKPILDPVSFLKTRRVVWSDVNRFFETRLAIDTIDLRELLKPRFPAKDVSTSYIQLSNYWKEAHENFYLEDVHIIKLVTHSPTIDNEAKQQVKAYLANEDRRFSFSVDAYKNCQPSKRKAYTTGPNGMPFLPSFESIKTKWEITIPPNLAAIPIVINNTPKPALLTPTQEQAYLKEQQSSYKHRRTKQFNELASLFKNAFQYETELPNKDCRP